MSVCFEAIEPHQTIAIRTPSGRQLTGRVVHAFVDDDGTEFVDYVELDIYDRPTRDVTWCLGEEVVAIY